MFVTDRALNSDLLIVEMEICCAGVYTYESSGNDTSINIFIWKCERCLKETEHTFIIFRQSQKKKS